MFERLMKNQALLDREAFANKVAKWWSIYNNFKKVHKDVTQVNMFTKLQP